MGTLVKDIIIKIGGKDNRKGFEDYHFRNISLSQHLLSPNQLRFTMKMKEFPKHDVAETYYIPDNVIGEKVYCKIETQRYRSDTDAPEDTSEVLEFKGIVFSANVYTSSNPASEKLIDITAYSADYLLMDHPHCFSYENDDLKKIVTATLDPHDIPNEINPRTTGPIPYTVQYNESNYQFLTRLARRYGEWMYHDGEKFIFGKIKKKNEGDPVKLRPRNDVLNFHFQTSIVHHKLKHAHHNYLNYENPLQSDSDVSGLTASGYHRLTDEVKKQATSLFKKETFQHLRCSNPEDNGINEPEVSIKAQLYGEKTRQTVCSGSSVRSDLTIGSCIKIGDYYFEGDESKKQKFEDMMITGIEHLAEVEGNYSNRFTAVSINSEYPPYYQSDIYPVSSAQRAKVMDNQDPEKLGRIRVQFLWQEEQDANLMTPWIRIAHPYAGSEKGFFFIPEIGEEVMVDFENGNAEKPYVVGALYHGKQKPRDHWYDPDSNDAKIIRSRNGHTILWEDEDDGGHIRIYDMDKFNYHLTFSTDEKLIKLQSKGNIELYADGDIIMDAGGNINMHSGKDTTIKVDGDQTITVDGKIDESAGGSFEHSSKEITMKSNSGVSIKATSTMKLESATHEQKASATMKLDGGGMLEAKAGMVKIN